MNGTRRCPDCGIEVPEDAVGELCPRCLAKGASDADRKTHEAATSSAAQCEFPTVPIPEATCVPVTEKPGDRLGHYKLLEQIGEGGMGSVRVAEQTEPIRRQVALKLIKLGMDTKQVIARFEAERQALALMDHPNIAKVFDAGATETGRPYFVMELVRGIPITEYCDRNSLSTTDRLKLLRQACRALQHAHQKGIIHRDLKPSNILVALQDGEPVPKVIDFGIAKATAGQRLTEKTLYTAFAEFIGTPTYISPEQAEMTGVGVDTRSDLYSLGVLLYELITGSTPLEAKRLLEAGLDEIRRIIREEDPPPPSRRLSTLASRERTAIAKHHASEPRKLILQARGDLDCIVMKCLEKDRTRRYETAGALADDITRYLDQEPVLATRPSWSHRLWKFLRRIPFWNTRDVLIFRLTVALVGVAVLVLLLLELGIGRIISRKPWLHGYSLYAMFHDVQNLKTGDPVRISGIQVGVVNSCRVDGETGLAVVEMILRRDVEVKTDSAAYIKSDVLRGSYVYLKGGSSNAVIATQGTYLRAQEDDPVSKLDWVLAVYKVWFGVEREAVDVIDPNTKQPARAKQDATVDDLNQVQQLRKAYEFLGALTPERSRALDQIERRITYLNTR